MIVVTFRVFGEPVPQGSTKAFPFRGKDGRTHVATTSASKGLGPWRQQIAEAARHALDGQFFFGADFDEDPFAVDLTFYVPRPKSARKKDITPHKRPDLDKLIRGALDSLTGIVFKDDGQVAEIVARKAYATQAEPLGLLANVRSLNPSASVVPPAGVAGGEHEKPEKPHRSDLAQGGS